ncbi:hypothetical protein PRIPAC_80296 [Pristionchus pacificus]|uniref:Serpentine receptor class gamma n=1 Tax=Pristionchus pacificus TaxID=54126 RepID=A0A2A6C313_PRIPA|nr:hypothetical protein PRIPAC_80296 [Pristionchus pacificus]|eukprot:PDM72622.1 G protein-coupled receptor [Pristionchus pacificus]
MHRGYAVIAIRVDAYHNLKTSLSIERSDPQSGEMLWHLQTTVSLMMLVCEFGGTSIIIVFCIWRITALIRSPNNHLTTKTRNMQINLFRALLIQTAVPILFSYIPLGAILVFPVVSGISLGAFGNVLFSVTSIFPLSMHSSFFSSSVDSEPLTFVFSVYLSRRNMDPQSSNDQNNEQLGMVQLSFKWSYDEPFHSTFLVCTMIISMDFFCSLSTLQNRQVLVPIGIFLLYSHCAILLPVSPMRHFNREHEKRSKDLKMKMRDRTSIRAVPPILLLHMTRGGVYFIPRHGPILIRDESYDRLICLLFATTYYQMFLILAYHFFYRYKTVTSAITRSFTNSWTLPFWIKLGMAVNILYISAILLIYAIVYGSETRTCTILDIYDIDLQDRRRWFIVLAQRVKNTGYKRFHISQLQRPSPLTGALVYHTPSVIALVMLFGVFAATGSVIVYCISKVNGMIGSSENTLTAKTRQMHADLFRALLRSSTFSQTGVPMLFSYLPCLLSFPVPIISDIELGTFGNVLYLSTSIFPSMDAFFILFFIKRFRIARKSCDNDFSSLSLTSFLPHIFNLRMWLRNAIELGYGLFAIFCYFLVFYALFVKRKTLSPSFITIYVLMAVYNIATWVHTLVASKFLNEPFFYFYYEWIKDKPLIVKSLRNIHYGFLLSHFNYAQNIDLVFLTFERYENVSAGLGSMKCWRKNYPYVIGIIHFLLIPIQLLQKTFFQFGLLCFITQTLSLIVLKRKSYVNDLFYLSPLHFLTSAT